MEEKLLVGRGEVAVSDDPKAVIQVRDVASGVALLIYDRTRSMGCATHVITPDSGLLSRDHPGRRAAADLALETLMAEITARDGHTMGCTAHVVGGADVRPSPDGLAVLALGKTIAEIVTTKLAASGLHIGRQELGGWRLRHVELRVGTGELEIQEI